MGDKRKARVMFWGSTTGHVISVALFAFDAISDRQLLALTLSLSWAALQYEGWNAMKIVDKETE